MKYRKDIASDEAVQRAMQEIRSRPTCPIWPTAAVVLGLGRTAAYGAAARGDLPILQVGGRSLVVTAKLREKLGITEVAA